MAAIAVLFFHVSEIAHLDDLKHNILPHGMLAVDFFFALSGFVVGHAYDQRWKAGMSLGDFALRRLVRLHPMVILATFVGLAVYLFGPFQGEGHRVPAGQLMMVTVLALLVLPYPSLPGRGDSTYSLDAPVWTLFQEYIANIAYALVLRHLSARVLLGLSVLAGGALIATAYHFGTLTRGFTWGTMWVAFVRLAFPFLFGLWLSRNLHRLPARRIGIWSLAALLVGAFALPAIGKPWNGVMEALLVILVFPVIILLGAHSRIGEASARTCSRLGRLSYPLYLLHYPFIYIYFDYRANAAATQQGMAAFSLILPAAMLALGWVGMKFWDEPVRAWLNRRLPGAPSGMAGTLGKPLLTSAPSSSRPPG